MALLKKDDSPPLLFFIHSVIWRTHFEARSGIAEVSFPDEWSWHSYLILLHGVTFAAVVLLYSCCSAFVKLRVKENAFNIKKASICPKLIICIFLIDIYMLHGKLCYIGSFIIYLFE